MAKKSAVWGAFLICIAASLWGFDGVVLTPQLYNLKVPFVVFMLHALPVVLMLPFFYKKLGMLGQFTFSDYGKFTILAVFGGALGTIAIVKALFLVNFNHLSVVVILQKLQPVFAIAMAYIFLKERTGKHYILWAGLAILGGYFLTFGFHIPEMADNDNITMAALYALLASISFASGTVVSKSILKKHDFKTATFFRFFFTAVIMVGVIAFNGQFSQFDVMTDINWLYFTIIAITTGSGAIFLYYYGLIRVRAIISTIAELCFPISAIVFEYFIHGKSLSGIQWAAASLMLFSIIMLNLRPRKS